LNEQLQVLYEPIDIYYYTAPLNRETEKEQLLASHTAEKPYNPKFIYHSPPSDWEQSLCQFISELKPDENVWEHWIYQDVVFTLNSMRAAVTRDPVLITETTVKTYGEPSKDLVQLAYAALAQIPLKSEPQTVSSKEVADCMREALNKAGLNDWNILVTPVMSARMSVRSVEKRVQVNAEALFTTNELKRLLIHEIGTQRRISQLP